MTRSAKLASSALIAAGALALHLTATPAMAGFVDCTKELPDSIQAQLFAGDTGITIRGTCLEDVFVIKDGTFFSGDFGAPGPHGIVGQVIMDSVQQVNFFDLTLQGPIFVAEGSTVEFNRTRITGPGNLSIFNNSVAQLFNGSSVEDKGGSVFVQNGGVILVDQTPIRNIAGGVFVLSGSRALANGSEITETDNGMTVQRGSVARLNNVTLGPARVDDGNVSCNPLCVGDNSDVRLQSTEVRGTNNDPVIGGAVSVFRNSSLLIRGNSSVANDGS